MSEGKELTVASLGDQVRDKVRSAMMNAIPDEAMDKLIAGEFANFWVSGNVRVTKTLPEFATKKTRKSFVEYNTRMGVLPEDPNTASYRRVAQPLRKRSSILDKIELIDKGYGVGNQKICLEEDFIKFVDDLTYEAAKLMIPVTHVTRVSRDKYGVEVWAAYSVQHVRRVVGRYGETLEIQIAPITSYRFTGESLKSAKKVLKKAKKGKI